VNFLGLPPPPPLPRSASIGSVDGQPFEERATGTPTLTHIRRDIADTEADTSATPAAPDSSRQPNRMSRYAVSCVKLTHRIAVLFNSPDNREHEVSLQMLKAGCHICLEQLSTLQTDIQRTSKTLRRIQKQANGRVRANPELEHTFERPFHSSRSSLLSNPLQVCQVPYV
jgi:hypothetical protein